MPKKVFKPLHAGDVRQYVVNKKKKKKKFPAPLTIPALVISSGPCPS
jgi:hypothetical protein